MKNLYHLLVTSYKLHVTNLLCRISDIGYRISFVAFCFLPFAAFAQVQTTITNIDFSCPGTVEITYDLGVVCDPVNVTLYYSPDKCDWSPAQSVTGALISQTTGTNKKITWDAAADNMSFGKFYFKVEYPSPPFPPEPTPVTINGVKWSPVNLDVGGWFCANPWDYGALYQWGREADGHECRNSDTTYTRSSTDSPGHSYFILTTSSSSESWYSGSNSLWNSGTETAPIKTATDPCPAGWRVPTGNELVVSLGGKMLNSTLETYPATTIQGRWFGDGGVPSLFLPAAGGRSNYDGTLFNIGLAGFYWSSKHPNTGGAFLPLDNGYYPIYMISPALGHSVRCVKMN